MTPLTLYNSLTRAAEAFVPIDPTNVRVYSCGPTVYHYAHIGNLRAYVFTDTLARVLRWKGYPLTHVINITDVGHLTSDADAGDDKMEAAAKASGQDIWAIAKHYTDAFKDNLSALNIADPTRFPLATDHVPGMIAFGEAIAADHCYRLADGLYFDTTTVPDYGRLARSRDDVGESRIDEVAGKRHPADFAIWRTSKPGENRQMEWDSPWGRGAPGWHLECSVMSRQYLGDRFDIHTGGIDHREIHHPNEIAQNQAMSGTPDTGAQLWMHNNFLVDRTGKMSKSSGEFLRLQALIDRGFHPLSYRLMCLQAHYRSELEFSWENLSAAFVRLTRFVILVEKARSRTVDEIKDDDLFEARLKEIDDALSDDLNTPRALAVVNAVLSDSKFPQARFEEMLQVFDDTLGLSLATLSRADLRVTPASSTISEIEIERRLDDRDQARATRDFARSDAIRDELAAAGVEVMDGDPLRWDWRIEL
ncbi:cysteine--tRNA ligase [Sphingomonas oligophenolica]|uniref:Cysteine--tRNA ligase n=1 Tax=Sphingomonas oligophenolica TaxID=301154 RepID=A0A502CKT3_9SPHN|nr:cysteine--tRNA ligase [Sphingomonas oligophenolica]TPG12729.1 cysteine--tRNA ligase [Sphingomonas oligophenolica]